MNKLYIILLATVTLCVVGCRHGDHHYHKSKCPPPRRQHFAPQPNAIHRAGPAPHAHHHHPVDGRK